MKKPSRDIKVRGITVHVPHCNFFHYDRYATRWYFHGLTDILDCDADELMIVAGFAVSWYNAKSGSAAPWHEKPELHKKLTGRLQDWLNLYDLLYKEYIKENKKK